MRFVVISEKKRSTRLSQDALVGVKYSLKRGCLASHAFHIGGLVRPIVIEHEMHREVSKHGSIDPLQKANELFRPMPRLAFADDESALHVEGCEQRGGLITLVRYDRLRAAEGGCDQRRSPRRKRSLSSSNIG